MGDVISLEDYKLKKSIEALPKTLFTKEEWFEVSKLINPNITQEMFDKEWEEYLVAKAPILLHFNMMPNNPQRSLALKYVQQVLDMLEKAPAGLWDKDGNPAYYFQSKEMKLIAEQFKQMHDELSSEKI